MTQLLTSHDSVTRESLIESLRNLTRVKFCEISSHRVAHDLSEV